MAIELLGGRPDPRRKGIIHRSLIVSGRLETQAVHLLALSRNDLANRLRLRLADGRCANDTLRYFRIPRNGKHTVFDCSMPRDLKAQEELERSLRSQLSKLMRELAHQKKKGKVVMIMTR